MKGLIQRVTQAQVVVNGELIAAIPSGLLLFLGVERMDGSKQAKELCKKILNYRVFPDSSGRMNLCVKDTEGSLLVVPQFTLVADTRTGTRPGFSGAADPGVANELFQQFVTEAEAGLGKHLVKAGEFGADMQISLINDGPVTFMLETRRIITPS